MAAPSSSGAASIPARVLLLVGRTGAGKSSLANAILGTRTFVARRSLSSVTRACEAHGVAGDRDGLQPSVVVVDTPGLCDTSGMTQTAVVDAIATFCEAPGTACDESVAKAVAGGIDAMLVVLNPLERAPPDLLSALRLLRLRFGERIMELATAVFTHADVLAGDGIATVDDLLADAGQDAAELVSACGGGAVIVDARMQDSAAWWGRDDLRAIIESAQARCDSTGGPARVPASGDEGDKATLAAARVASDAADALRGALSDAALFNRNGVAADPMFASLDAPNAGASAAKALDRALDGVLAMVRGHAAANGSASPHAPNLAAALQRARAGERALPRREWDLATDLAGTFEATSGVQLALEGVGAGVPEMSVRGELVMEAATCLEVGSCGKSAIGGSLQALDGVLVGGSSRLEMKAICDARGYALQLRGPISLKGPVRLLPAPSTPSPSSQVDAAVESSEVLVRDDHFLDEGVYRVDLMGVAGEGGTVSPDARVIATLVRTERASGVLVGVPSRVGVSVPDGCSLELDAGAILTVEGLVRLTGGSIRVSKGSRVHAVGFCRLACSSDRAQTLRAPAYARGAHARVVHPQEND